ncbi:unnamed protein product, partial [Darwinula stevensoni]
MALVGAIPGLEVRRTLDDSLSCLVSDVEIAGSPSSSLSMPKASRDKLTGETLTVSSPIPSPEMGFMDLQESHALHTLSDGFDSSFHSSMNGPIDQSTPRKSQRMRSDYRFECCIGIMATRDLLDTECEMKEMSAKEKETFLARLIQENSSCHRQTEQREKLRRRKKSAVPKRIRTSPKVKVAEAWMTNFLRWHGQHSPCSTKIIYVQGYNAKELHQLMICSLSKGIPKENLLHYTIQRLTYQRHRLMALEGEEWMTIVVD